MQEERLLTRKDEAMKVLDKYDLVLDAAHPTRNRNIFFYPLQESLEGETQFSRLFTDRPPGAILQLSGGGGIPGDRLLVDTKSRAAKIIDRKSLPEYKEMLKEAMRIGRAENYRHAAFNSVRGDRDYSIGDPDWPTWLYHIKVLVEAEKLRVVKGNVPTMKEIRAAEKSCGYPVRLSDNNGMSAKEGVHPFWLLPPEKETEKAGAK